MMIKKFLLSLFFVGLSFGAFAQLKIAFSDVNYIINQMPEVKAVDTELRGLETQLSAEIQTLGQQLQQEVQAYSSASGTMTDEAKASKEQELQAKQQEIQQKQQSAQQTLQQKYAELLSPIRDKVMDAIKKVAEANGYTHVFSKAVSGNLIVYFPNVEEDNAFSDLVLKELGVTPEE